MKSCTPLETEEGRTFFKEIDDVLVDWRRLFHKHPEEGWLEYHTTYVLGKELSKLDFSLFVGKDALISEQRMGVPDGKKLAQAEERARDLGVPEDWMEKMTEGHTGLVAQWDTGKVGPHVAFRFDIDALPILESDDESHTPQQTGFRSVHKGSMHACAHDGHAAIGLGVAHFIHRFQKQLKGKFTLLFQPAEEGSRGAKAMVEKGWLDDVDYFLSGHIGVLSLNIGSVAATTSGFLATTKINVTFHGKSAHAGMAPHEGKNALLAAASATTHLQAITRHGQGATRVNVGLLKAGSGRNIISDNGYMELETRGETTELNEFMVEETKRILQATAQLHNVTVEIDIVGQGISAECDSMWVDRLEQSCESSSTIKNVISSMRIGGSEDVTYMIERVQQRGGKATYMIFGTPLANGHHHPQFDYDEEVLPIAVETFGRLIFNLIKDSKGSDLKGGE
ncbi:amidohydrolase [Alkalihalobacillus sp. BA299]|uniref:amidohydrolase n=1 Tax=Alkalihalobacillus sp. BA299 TaxID=2815938 RepID=UPI001ADC40AF|nr:amidohydrolase [Alkalihalobacillus sp. BA299]